MSQDEVALQGVHVQSLLTLIELQRHFGMRDFRHRDVLNCITIHGSSNTKTAVLRRNGWIEKQGNKLYCLTDKAVNLISYVRGVLI